MKSSLRLNFILIVIAIVIAVCPLVLVRSSNFGGADNKASELILEKNPDYKPWFKSLWAPPGGETESLLFALQAAAGAGITGWVIGFYMGRRRI